MKSPPIVRFNNVVLKQTDGVLFEDVSFSIQNRQRVCLIGRNGCGKSTLLKCISGHVDIDGGERLLQPGLRIGLLAQEPDLSQFDSVEDFGLSGGAEPYRLRSLADALKVDLSRSPAGLSGGEARRAALAKTLSEASDLLLLDEPTNHLDIDSIAWLEDELKGFAGAVVTISHDRAFLANTTKQILWLDRGRARAHDRGFGNFDAWSDEVLAQEAEQLAKMDKKIAEETIWSKQGISARRKRNQGRLRRLYELRDHRAQARKQGAIVKVSLDSGDSSGKVAIEAVGISKSYAGRCLLKPFDLKVLRGERIGIVGPNGAGKTTLLTLLLGKTPPDGGTVKLGTNLTPTFIDQKRDSLKPGMTAWEYLADSGGDSIIVGGKPRHVVTYMQEFLFSKSQARSPVQALSGGERNRLTLAKAVANPSNVLILDEPTNDLDMETLDLLQEMLGEYKGTLLLVSHDRDFLDRIVDSTIILDGLGGAFHYPGGYGDAASQHDASHLAKSVSSGNSPISSDAKPGAKTGYKTGARAGTKASVKTNVKTSVKASTKTSAKTDEPKKLTYAQEIRLKKLPDLMAKAETDIAALEQALSKPDLYSRDPDAFTKTSKKIGARREELEGMELEWLELEELAERGS